MHRSATSSRSCSTPAFPEWNPAFSAVSAERPATVRQHYPIRVRGFLRGELVYDRISDSEIAVTMRIPGLTERGTWSLAEVRAAPR